MKYILIGYLLGSFVHSEHDTREACEGRAVMLREQKAIVKCVEAPINTSGTITAPGQFWCNGSMCIR